MLIPVFFIMFEVYLLYGLLTDGHRFDGNVWAIYVGNNHFMIGDFWHALLVLWLIYVVWDDIRNLLKTKKKGDKRDGKG